MSLTQEQPPKPTDAVAPEGHSEAFIPYPPIGENLEHVPIHVRPDVFYYQARMAFLRAVGLECEKPRATFYVWVSTPGRLSSAEFTAKLLEEAGVVTTPGNGFGEAGEGYVRFTVCVDKSKLKEVAERIRQIKL